MFGRRIKIPRMLHELHGEETSVGSLILVYIMGIAGAIIVTVYAININTGIPLWKLLILFLLSVDIFGGIVANFSRSTNEFYAGKKNLQIAFVLLHIFHPIVLWYLFGGVLSLWLIVALYILGTALGILYINNLELRQVVAAAVVAIGILLFSIFSLSIPFLAWFPIAFMIKLDLGFAARCYKLSTS